MTGPRNRLTYTIIVDNATGPDPNSEGLQLMVSPNPGNFSLLDSDYIIGSTKLIRILVSLPGVWCKVIIEMYILH